LVEELLVTSKVYTNCSSLTRDSQRVNLAESVYKTMRDIAAVVTVNETGNADDVFGSERIRFAAPREAE